MRLEALQSQQGCVVARPDNSEGRTIVFGPLFLGAGLATGAVAAI